MKKTAEKKNTISFVVDVGNSHTVIGIFKDTKVVDYWRLTTRKETTSDEVMNKVGGLLRFSKIKSEEITHVGLSTVVPALERPWIWPVPTVCAMWLPCARLASRMQLSWIWGPLPLSTS